MVTIFYKKKKTDKTYIYLQKINSNTRVSVIFLCPSTPFVGCPTTHQKTKETERAHVFTTAYIALLLIEKIATLSEAIDLIPIEAEGLLNSHVEVPAFGEEV